MKPTDISALRVPGAPTLSPDGTLAVVALQYPDLDTDDYAAHLWLVPTTGSLRVGAGSTAGSLRVGAGSTAGSLRVGAGGTDDRSAPARRLTHGWRDTVPAWSPDGRWIAFLRAERDPGTGKVGRPQLWLLPATGGEPRRLTDHPLGIAGPPAARGPAWSPDSRRLAYTARVPEPGRYGTDPAVPPEAEPPRRLTTLVYRVDNVGWVVDRRAHLWVVGIDGEEPVRVTDGDHDHTGGDWSPDGELLAYAAARHPGAGDDRRVDVWVCRPDGTGTRPLTKGGLAAGHPRFTPDGRAVCFVASDLPEPDRDEPDGAARQTGVWTVPVDGSAPPRRLTDPDRFHLGRPAAVIEPTADGVLATDEHRGGIRLLRVPYQGGEPQVLVDGHRQVLGAATTTTGAASDDGARPMVVCTVADPATPGELAVLTGGGPEPLSSWGEELGTRIPVAPMRELTTSAPDGQPVHGWMLRPDGPGPHPVLLMIHGGPFFQYGWTLFDEAQVYTGAGYAVVMGNPRGSSGYGRQHGRAVAGNVGEVSATDLLALLDAALDADPALDRDRVGVMGGSHGGFMTTWLAAHHGGRFRAAISERALNAIDSFAGTSDIGWFFADDLYGPDPARQAAQSPLTHADRIDIPMLIIHSEQDWRCPLEQAQRLFANLKRRGVPVEMLLFPGEGHELSRSGRPSHRVARFEAVLEWWSRHLDHH